VRGRYLSQRKIGKLAASGIKAAPLLDIEPAQMG
jgi:hypothetical protein